MQTFFMTNRTMTTVLLDLNKIDTFRATSAQGDRFDKMTGIYETC